MTESDRIPYITSREAVPMDQRHHYDSIEESRGGISGPFEVLLNSPELAGRIGHLGAYVRYEGELPDEDRELAILTTARAFDCAYEWAAHVPIAKEAGVREEAINVVADTSPTDSLEDREEIIIQYGRQLFGDSSISDRTFAVTFDTFGKSGITELTATMGYYSMIACVLNAFEVNPSDSQPTLP